MVTTWQMFVSLGIFLGFFANMICFRLGNDKYWKWMLAAAGLPALLMFFVIPFCPESPRWLLRQNRVGDALEALFAIHPFQSKIIASGDLLYIYESLHGETNWILEKEGAGSESQEMCVVSTDRTKAEDDVSVVSDIHEIKKAGWALRWRMMRKSQRMRS